MVASGAIPAALLQLAAEALERRRGHLEPARLRKPFSQTTNSSKVRWMSIPITRRMHPHALAVMGATGDATPTDPQWGITTWIYAAFVASMPR